MAYLTKRAWKAVENGDYISLEMYLSRVTFQVRGNAELAGKFKASLIEKFEEEANQPARDLKLMERLGRALVLLDPEDAEGLTLLGTVLLEQGVAVGQYGFLEFGNLVESWFILEKALRLDPNNTTARENLEAVKALGRKAVHDEVFEIKVGAILDRETPTGFWEEDHIETLTMATILGEGAISVFAQIARASKGAGVLIGLASDIGSLTLLKLGRTELISRKTQGESALIVIDVAIKENQQAKSNLKEFFKDEFGPREALTAGQREVLDYRLAKRDEDIKNLEGARMKIEERLVEFDQRLASVDQDIKEQRLDRPLTTEERYRLRTGKPIPKL